jgi:hypothetical protein
LDPRSAKQFYAQLSAVQAAFIPELPSTPQGKLAALLQMVARFSSIISQRLNQAPDLDKLSFLDMLGISLIPAQPARAPLVFTPLPLKVDGTIPAATRAGARLPGSAAPIVFETENDIAMTAAQLTQVVSLWPERDCYADHSHAFAGAREFSLFKDLSPVEHVLYLSQATLLAFKGTSQVEVRFTLATNGSKPVNFRWEFWDGNTWREFRDFDPTDFAASQDATAGLTRTGVITLQAECGDSVLTSVANISNYWIRGRLAAALPPDPSRTFAVASHIELRTTIDRSLTHGPGGVGCQGVAKIDRASSGGTPLDLTKIFYPLGKAPGTDDAFYFVSQEVFSKPGAKVTLCFDRARTPEEEGDSLGNKYTVDVKKAKDDLIAAAQNVAQTAIDAAQGVIALNGGQDPGWTKPVSDAVSEIQKISAGLVLPSDIVQLSSKISGLVSLASMVPANPSMTGPILSQHVDQLATIATLAAAKLEGVQDLNAAAQAATDLAGISAIGAAAAGGAPPPSLSPPRLQWEYYNESEWRTLMGPVNDDVTNLVASGEITFTVPDDIKPFTINGSSGLGMRARLVSGSYNSLLLVSWTDPTSGKTNFIPVIQPRPPALERIAIGYVYRSRWTVPDQSLSWNDFVVESHTPTPMQASANYAPYHPVADTLPALYLGFNQPLPNNYLSMFFDIVESDIDGPPLVWEGWSAGRWQTLTVSDDTGALARRGMVAFLNSGVPARPRANVISASGSLVTVSVPLAAAVFKAGDQIVIQADKAAELAVIDSIHEENIHLVTPLAGNYSNTTASLAALPRFGKSLDWVRARLKSDGTPTFSKVKGIFPNAVWARQVQTVKNETLGSGLGHPSQSLFFQQFPVLPGEQVQVRELAGAQANVEFPVLQEQLQSQGFVDDDIRVVLDPRSGLLTEVWVTWVEQPNFYFSKPTDRHYVLDRASGRIIFGNGINGMLPAVGNSNILAFHYQAGGGHNGNVIAGAIRQLLGGATAQSVTNPVPAEGGADTEDLADIIWRGPQVLRHRGSALAAADYEALALEASPGVAIARCLPATSANLLPAPGWVTLIVVPHSLNPQPEPSYELKQEVIEYIARRAPSVIEIGRITVIPPAYLPVGVSASVAAKELGDSGIVKNAVISAIQQFFHPLYGGPEGRGWSFGRDVYLSDVARLLEGVSGVDYVRNLEMLLKLIPSGDRIYVPSERIIAAGPMLITMVGAATA